ncbi:MAG TPA: OmpA family protein, partial [Phaeodactylibacter sp.]|nr:OmpA family protein [Phaeodactylibacter sp.]
GNTLYFSRKGHPQNVGSNEQYDIWIAFRKSDDTWTDAIRMPLPINDKSDNYIVSANIDDTALYLCKSDGASKQLLFTRRRGRSWTSPIPVEIQNFEPKPSVRYAMNHHQDVLLLMMDAGQGDGMDIYISTKINTRQWASPIPVGNTINTSEEEYFAYLADDNKTLFFLSKGYGTGIQLMVSQRVSKDDWTQWSEPKATNIHFDATMQHGYFSLTSDANAIYTAGRNEESADLALRYIALQKNELPATEVTLVSGALIDIETGQPIQGNILVESLKGYDESKYLASDGNGQFRFVWSSPSSFQLSAEVPGYFAKSELIAKRSLEELDKEEGADAQKQISSPEIDQLYVRLRQINKSLEELLQERASIQQQIKKAQQTNSSPVLDEETLHTLRLEYQKALGLGSQEDVSPTGDNELDDMKRAYRKHNDVERSTRNKRKGKPHAQEDQLSAMKRKYREANSIENVTNTNTEEEVIVASTAEFSTEDGFDDFVLQVQHELKEEMSERVVKELQADLIQEVAFNMQNDLDPQSRHAYARTLQQNTDAIENQVRKALRKKYRRQVKRELKGELLEVVEEELRGLLYEQVKQALRRELEDEVRKELRLELEYLLTQEMANDTQKELAKMIKRLKKNKVDAPANYFSGDTANKTQQRKNGKADINKKIELQLYPLNSGTIIPLENIFFQANSDQWKDCSLPELNRVLDLLLQHKSMKVEIGAHSNGWCSNEFANKLTVKRAKAIADFLIQRGIEKNRISWRGYGKTQPNVPNDSIENCKKNQRIELKIL